MSADNNPRKRSIYFGDGLLKALESRAPLDNTGNLSVSAAINMMAARYDMTAQQSLPPFTVNEWSVLFDAMNGTITWDRADTLTGQWMGVADAIRMEDLDRKWEVDGAALIEKLRALSFCQSLAWVDACERFWTLRSRTWDSMDDALKELGIPVIEHTPVPRNTWAVVVTNLQEADPQGVADLEYFFGGHKAWYLTRERAVAVAEQLNREAADIEWMAERPVYGVIEGE